jgi:copper homeostasis protein
MILEIATNDFETTRLAVQAGADRIELCAALTEGGITQSPATLERCRNQFSLPLFPIIRPRGGDFLYTDHEFQLMQKDILYCRSLGMDGVVIGLLQPDGSIDKKRTAALVELAYPMGVTFHRAFDRCKDPFLALETLIEIGCERILTSGQQLTAPAGSTLIKQLQQTAADQIIIMPGSGVREDNIVALAKETGCKEFHTSVRKQQPSSMLFKHPSFSTSEDSYENPGLSVEAIRSIIALLKDM